MPRRPRPASRRPPTYIANANQDVSSRRGRAIESRPREARPTRTLESEASTSGSESEGVFDDQVREQPESVASDSNSEDAEHYSLADVNIDQARVAQWVDEEELDELSDESESDPGPSERLERLTSRDELDLASLPFGTLRKAQRQLARTSSVDESDTDKDESEPEQGSSRYPAKMNGKEPGESSKTIQEIPKRANKHAPTEVSSKRPVPRKKLATEGERPAPRDPRFLPVTGDLSTTRFRAQYGFLWGMHAQEMQTLKENMKRARKLLANSPRDLRQEREQEVQRLERAYKRAESLVNKNRREKIEQDALEKAAKEEKEKRKAGKNAWYLKNVDKKELLVRAKYEALAASGGRIAVKKAIERRQKKANQKEKRKRPSTAASSDGGDARERPGTFQYGGEHQGGKRRRIG